MCQTSPESANIFCLLTSLFRSQSLESLKKIALEKEILTEDEFQSLLIFYSGFLYNSGNYLGFGDRKFVPTVNREKLLALIKVSKAYEANSAKMMKYFDETCDLLYDLSEGKKFLGFSPNGVTMYFTPNCTKEDAEIVGKYMTARKIEAWNTRVIKHETEKGCVYDVRYASIEKSHSEGLTVQNDEFDGQVFQVTRGDYS